MPSVVNDSCALCKSCIEVCPVGAFHDAGTQVVVNPDECIDCGICISECPRGAISSSDTADEKWIRFNAEKAATCPKAE